MMDYPAAVAHLLSLGLELKAGKFGLENVTKLAAALNHPERSCPAVLIAGTNGKGSTAAMTESVLRAAGYRTGLYTSPHLVRINERIRVDGEEISDLEFAACCNRVHEAVERLLASGELEKHPSFFECLTALAFLHFQDSACQIVVLEVGMGGRLDATNIVRPLVSVITPVDFDHEQYLGNTIELIAGEKAGIIKPGGVVVISTLRPEAEQVIRQVAAGRGARLVRAEATRAATYELSLKGAHQVENAATVLAVIDELRSHGWDVSEDAVRRGLAGTLWPGRLECVGRRPAVYLDGAHNPSGARVLRAFLETTAKPRVMIFGAMRDKAVEEIAGILFPVVDAVVLTEPSHKRALGVATLREVAGHFCTNLHMEPNPERALEQAVKLAGVEGTVIAAGSLYLVGDLKRIGSLTH